MVTRWAVRSVTMMLETGGGAVAAVEGVAGTSSAASPARAVSTTTKRLRTVVPVVVITALPVSTVACEPSHHGPAGARRCGFGEWNSFDGSVAVPEDRV